MNRIASSSGWNFTFAVAPDVVNEARRRMDPAQPTIICISTLVKFFQFETAELSTRYRVRGRVHVFRAVEVDAPIDPLVRSTGADGLDPIDVKLSERRRSSIRRVNVLGGIGDLPTR